MDIHPRIEDTHVYTTLDGSLRPEDRWVIVILPEGMEPKPWFENNDAIFTRDVEKSVALRRYLVETRDNLKK